MIPVATLGMYDYPWTAQANDALWAAVAKVLGPDVAAGQVPLDRDRPLRELWLDPALRLGQTCGYPLMTELAGKVRLVATPRYGLPGCDGAWHRSLIVVQGDDESVNITEFRGRRVAINGRDSNTGMNLLRATVAPVAGGARFFGTVIETGSHLASLAAVREGRADIAAIDCVTHGLTARHRPDLLEGTRELGETPGTPALPFITRLDASDTEVEALQHALRTVLAAPENESMRWALGLDGIEILPLEVYGIVLDLQREAIRLGYPEIA
jgi:ABC-type phosphate/phosphonate transport system substrate-binding protein